MRKVNMSGAPIRGSTEAFQIEAYRTNYNELMTLPPDFDKAYGYRSKVKYMTADRMRVAISDCSMFEVLPRDDILAALPVGESKEVREYLSCLIDYYNDEAKCVYKTDRTKCKKSDRGHKTITYAIRDVELLLRTDVRRVERRLRKCNALGEEQVKILNIYGSIYTATNYFLELIRNIYDRQLPKRLNVTQMNCIKSIDDNISGYYTENENGEFINVKDTSKPIGKCCSSSVAIRIVFDIKHIWAEPEKENDYDD